MLKSLHTKQFIGCQIALLFLTILTMHTTAFYLFLKR